MDYAIYSPRIMAGRLSTSANAEGRKNLQKNIQFLRDHNIVIKTDEKAQQYFAEVTPRNEQQ